jgi:hypothetical protein
MTYAAMIALGLIAGWLAGNVLTTLWLDRIGRNREGGRS